MEPAVDEQPSAIWSEIGWEATLGKLESFHKARVDKIDVGATIDIN
jgi:hypothetical protein